MRARSWLARTGAGGEPRRPARVVSRAAHSGVALGRTVARRRIAALGRTVALCALLTACAIMRGGQPVAVRTGPERGALVIAGGGRLDADIMGRFVQLAGGSRARIVVIPTAATGDSFPERWDGVDMFRAAGVHDVRVLHTRQRATAELEEFVRPLRDATGVWITGGRQWRLVDSYLGTLTMRELHALLGRGGVIGGTSAGASIQASYMVRGAVESNTIMMAPGYETGFGMLRNAAIDQHLLARGRQDDMLAVVARFPHLLGVGIDEGTALIVRGDTAEVVGRGRVAFYNATDRGPLAYYFLGPGGAFDLGARRALRGAPATISRARDEAEILATIDRLFDAMRARDTAVIRAVSHPELRLYVPGEQNGQPALSVRTLDQFITAIAGSPQQLDERAIDPTIHVDGPLASVWTYYDFRRGDTFSHCGFDAFHLARGSGGWTIIGLAYTTRQANCR